MMQLEVILPLVAYLLVVFGLSIFYLLDIIISYLKYNFNILYYFLNFYFIFTPCTPLNLLYFVPYRKKHYSDYE